jgi:hypothetical protein
MKSTINLYEFRDAFTRMDRADAFTYEGLEILFQGIEEFEEDTNEEWELDVIALCCDFSEMSEEEIKQSYNVNLEESSQDMDDWLNNQTWVLGKTDSGNYVFRQF